MDDDPTTGFLHRKLTEKFRMSRDVEVLKSGEEVLQLIEHLETYSDWHIHNGEEM